MRRVIHYAIVGCGMMGQEHLRNIDLLGRCGTIDTRISWLVDPHTAMRESARQLALELGHSEVRLASHAEAIDAAAVASLDAIVLATPNHTHCRELWALLKWNLPILVEKPLGISIDELDRIEQRLKTHQAPVWVAMEYRFMPPTARFIERLRAGTVGRLHRLAIREYRYPFLEKVGHWNRFNANTGGTLVEKCCHHFDLMRLITGAEAVRVYASGGMAVNHREETYEGRVPDVIDHALVIVEFDNAVAASLDLCMFAEGAEPQEQLTAIGDEAKLDVYIPGPDRFWPNRPPLIATVERQPRTRAGAERETIDVEPAITAAGDHHGGTYYQHRHFADVILERTPVLVSASDGAAAVRIGLAAQQSMRSGQAVAVPSRGR